MRVAVIVPGIMGSVLHYEDGSGGLTEIWGENFWTNYQLVIDQPELLAWDGTVAKASVLETAYISEVIRLKKWSVWKRMLDWLAGYPAFSEPGGVLKLGYDWRRSLVDSSVDFAVELQNRAAADADERNLAPDEPRFTFITHSMGGLLLRCALAQRAISPDRIDRIIHVGTPLEGAPAAFAGMYETGSLPFLREAVRFLHPFKNAGRLFRKILETMQTFPSGYQVMPPVGQNFLFYQGGVRTNPFVDPNASIPAAMRQKAAHAHQLLLSAEQIIRNDLSGKTFTIYTEHHSDQETDWGFNVAAVLGGPGGYEILDTLMTEDGDGTVPASSAQGRLGSSIRKPVKNVTHSTMCDNREVVGIMPGIV